MPDFILSEPGNPSHPFYSLNPFARGYVEAMFFTNADTGDAREDRANELGLDRLTKGSVAAIERDCAAFEREAAPLLAQAYQRDYSAEQAGRDFWFTRQGHGVGFWGRDVLEPDGLGAELTDIAKRAGETYPEIYRGWIYHR